jgi:hypothetical protein
MAIDVLTFSRVSRAMKGAMMAIAWPVTRV